MTRTPNHGYNVPEEGTQDWHEPLNENFERYDADIELRDEAANRDGYEPKAGAKFLATDTGVVSVGDGSEWIPAFQIGRYSAPSDSSNAGGVAFGDPANEAGGDGATVAGGQANEAAHDHCTVSGGLDNRASRGNATVGGGQGNQAVDDGATVGGGIDNRAGGDGATVAGGRENIASGPDSFAAGRKAEAVRPGSFVWNNSGNRFLATDDNQFLVNAVGGVGIGTNSPDAPLHIGARDDPALAGDFLIGTSTAHLSVSVETEGSNAGTTRLKAVGEEGDRHNLHLESGDARLSLQDMGTNDPMFVPFEDLGVNLGHEEYSFHEIYGYHGSFSHVYAYKYHETSDARLKRNVSPLDDGLDTVSELRPVTYEWKEEDREDGRQLGLIAQDVEEVLPEVVAHQDLDGEGEDDTLAVSYTKLVPVLIDAIQRQQEGIEKRENRIDELEAESERKDDRIDDLEERLAALEARVGHDAGTAPADD